MYGIREDVTFAGSIRISEIITDYILEPTKVRRKEAPERTRLCAYVNRFFAEHGGILPNRVVFFDIDETIAHRPHKVREAWKNLCATDPTLALETAHGPLDQKAMRRLNVLHRRFPEMGFVCISAWAEGRTVSLLQNILRKEKCPFAESLYGKTVDHLEVEDEDALCKHFAPNYLEYIMEDDVEIAKKLGLSEDIEADFEKWERWTELRTNFLERTLKICLWLVDHPEVTSFVIFDDRVLEVHDKDPEMNPNFENSPGIFGGRCIRVDPVKLITKGDIRRALALLHKPFQGFFD